MDTLLAWLPVLSVASTALSAVLVWGFASGRWLQKQEDGKESLADRLSEVESDITSLQKAFGDFIQQRYATVERINTDLGRHEQRIAILERERQLSTEFAQREMAAMLTRLATIEAVVREIERNVPRRTTDRSHNA